MKLHHTVSSSPLARGIGTLLVVALLLGGCATSTTGPEGSVRQQYEEQLRAGYGRLPAVETLLQQSAERQEQGRPDQAVSLLERAVRIDGLDPLVWHQLARLRYQQRELAQAEQLALKSARLARDNRRLKAANWRLIAGMRAAGGNPAGARDALERARQLEDS